MTDFLRLKDINVENGGKFGVLIKGRPENPVKNVTLTNVHIKGAKTPLSIENSEPVIFKNTTINGKEYTRLLCGSGHARRNTVIFCTKEIEQPLKDI